MGMNIDFVLAERMKGIREGVILRKKAFPHETAKIKEEVNV
jgi:ABC-type dipeptide/oligopeptide/nickel transport system permease component